MRSLLWPAILAIAAGCGVEVSADDMPQALSTAAAAAPVTAAPGATAPDAAAADAAAADGFGPPLTTVLYSDRDAELATRMDGVVRSIAAELGDQVAAGDVLAQLDDARERARVTGAAAAVELATSEHRRAHSLHEGGLITAAEYETALYRLRTAEAELRATEVELGYTRLTAPFAGVVTRRMTGVGRSVREGEPLYRLTALQPLHALLRVAERDARAVRAGTAVLLQSEDGVTVRGVVQRVSPAVDPASGTVELLVAVPRPGSLRPGSTATARLALAR